MQRDWSSIFINHEGKTIGEVARLENVRYETVQRAASRLKVTLPDGRSVKKIPFNENFFSVIDTEAKAYWLGFLMADGYVNYTKGYIELTLKATDEEILHSLSRSLNMASVSITTPREGIVRLVLYSKRMVDDLSTLGCTQAKTHTIEFPVLPPQLERHFIRGYFDGDGSYTVSNRTFDLTGRRAFLLQVIDRFVGIGLNALKVYQRHPERGNDISYIRYGGKHVSRILYEYLYSGASVYLSRKKLKFEKGMV